LAQRKRIGDRLLEAGLITQEQLEMGLKEQKKTGELLGSILFGLGFVSQKDLFHLLSISYEGSADSLPRDEETSGGPEIESLIRQSAVSSQAEGPQTRKGIESAHSPIVRLVDKIIMGGIDQQATDVHIGPDIKGVRARYRVDGRLKQGMFAPRDLLNAIVSRIKIIGNMNIAETRIPQDGSSEFIYKAKKFDLRISTFPVMGGENVVVRILDKSQLKLGLESLGFSFSDTERVNEILKTPYGMVLVTGPTGSGKTTTLYSCLSLLNTVNKHIFTIEDPVEYQMPLIRQAQVNTKAGLTFATGLRSILRQDPDIILVGEMRDVETAELAVRAALTGHLVFSTLHTNDAVTCIMRLMDMGIDPFLVTGTLDTVIAQRLVRLLCTECREELPAGDPLYQTLHSDPQISKIFRAKGCSLCGETGYKGRTVIYEILKISPALRDMINRRMNVDDIKQQALKEGFRPMFELGLEKVKAGLTTLVEVSSVARAAE
jgi:type IV pilus assembly protein PilB